MPREFVLYRFCKEFRCLPEDVERMDAALFDQFRQFMSAEAAAGRLLDMQTQFYGR